MSMCCLKYLQIFCLVFACAASAAAQTPRPLRIGDVVPPIELTVISPAKDKLNIGTLKGKPFIVDVWATWCAPCIASMPAMHSLQERFKDGIRILLVNDTESREKIDKFIEKRSAIANAKITLPVIMADDPLRSLLSGRQAIPSFYWIDANGILRYITAKAEVNESTIASFIATGKMEKPATTHPIVLWKSELDVGSTGDNSRLKLGADGSTHISCSGYSVEKLYRFAYGKFITGSRRERSWVHPFPVTRVKLELLNTRENNTEKTLYSYSLTAPHNTSMAKLAEVMQSDLDERLNCHSSVKPAMIEYLSVTIPDTTVFSGKDFGKTDYKVTDTEFVLNAISIPAFVRNLEDNISNGYHFLSRYPVVDQSGYKGLVGGISIDGIDTSDPVALDRALKPYGVRFKLVRGALDILTIRCEATTQ